jgi:hypothetical protein
VTLLHIDMDICIPWRSDNGWRAQVFDWVLPAWQRTGLDVRVGHDDGTGPINVSKALNHARSQSSSAVLVIASADHIPDVHAVIEASAAAMDHGWAPLFTATAGISLDATRDVINGLDVDVTQHITGEAPFCTALLAVRADVWDEIGGWDERFHGWGCEDTAFRIVLETLYPDPPELTPRRSIALWHEAADRSRFDANVLLLNEYIACQNQPDTLREMLRTRAS